MMKNKKLKFKTNIMCGSCVAKVAHALDEAAGKDSWTVDLANADKILSVDSGADSEIVASAVQSAGFWAEPYKRKGFF